MNPKLVINGNSLQLQDLYTQKVVMLHKKFKTRFSQSLEINNIKNENVYASIVIRHDREVSIFWKGTIKINSPREFV